MWGPTVLGSLWFVLFHKPHTSAYCAYTMYAIHKLPLSFCCFRVDYLHALELDPSHLPARVNLAFVLQAEGKFQEAWIELTSAIKTNKHYVPALEARAIISLQMGNLFEAFMDLTNALEVGISEYYSVHGSY